MKQDLTKDEVVELIKGNLNLEGWMGVICMGCRPKNDAPHPATANVEIGTTTWICPRCNFINLLIFRKQLPVFMYPDYGVLGSVIVKAYEDLAMVDLDFDFEQLSYA